MSIPQYKKRISCVPPQLSPRYFDHHPDSSFLDVATYFTSSPAPHVADTTHQGDNPDDSRDGKHKRSHSNSDRIDGKRTLRAEELAGDVKSLTSHDDDLLTVEQLLGDSAGKTTKKVSLAVNDDLQKNSNTSQRFFPEESLSEIYRNPPPVPSASSGRRSQVPLVPFSTSKPQISPQSSLLLHSSPVLLQMYVFKIGCACVGVEGAVVRTTGSMEDILLCRKENIQR